MLSAHFGRFAPLANGIYAAHVRTQHVHCVIGAVENPNRAIADLKAYSSRALNALEGERLRWAREGSTRRLLTPFAIAAAIRYVTDGQGRPMAVYVREREMR